MQRSEVSGAVRPIYGSLGIKRLTAAYSHARQHEESHYLCSNRRAGYRRERSLFSNIQPFCWVGVITTVNHYRVAGRLISLKQRTISLFCRLAFHLHFLDILHPQPKIKSILQAYSLPCKIFKIHSWSDVQNFPKTYEPPKNSRHQKDDRKQFPY